MEAPAFLILHVLWAVVPSFHMSYSSEGKEVMFEKEGEDVGFVFEGEQDGRGSLAFHAFRWVDPSWSLGEFNILENGVLLEVGGDGSHRPVRSKRVSDGNIVDYHLGPGDIS